MEEEYYDNMPPNEGQYSNMPPPEEELPEEERFFKDFTNQDIDNHDPSLGKDLIKIYEEEVPFEIRKEDEEISNSGTFESLLCKILTSDGINKVLHTMIEIICDKDLIDFIDSCIKDTKKNLVVLISSMVGKTTMELIENLEHKL